MAVAKAGVEAYTVMSYPAKKSFYEQLMETTPGNLVRSYMLKGKAGELYGQLRWVNDIDRTDRVQARIPFEPNIN
jgi:protease-4